MDNDEFHCHQDEDDQAAADLAEYEMYVREQNRKARALLLYDSAFDISDPVVEKLIKLVQQYAVPHTGSTLNDMLRDTVAELLISNELEESVLLQLVSREGYIAIRKLLDRACDAFEAFLAAESAKWAARQLLASKSAPNR